MSCGIAGFALSGCGLVSGLDTLHVDASADATTDAVTADGASDDGGVDAGAVTADAAADGATINCGSQVCTGGTVCCINASDANKTNCAKACSGGNLVLRCDDKSDCTNNQSCCYGTSGSQCGPSGTNTCTALCSDASQCTGGSQCVPFDAGYGLSLMRCQ